MPLQMLVTATTKLSRIHTSASTIGFYLFAFYAADVLVHM